MLTASLMLHTGLDVSVQPIPSHAPAHVIRIERDGQSVITLHAPTPDIAHKIAAALELATNPEPAESLLDAAERKAVKQMEAA